MARIAFIGLGNMGRPMAANLIAAGHALVVHDRLPDVSDPLTAAGARAAPEAASAAAGAEVTITMLPEDSPVRDVYQGEGGVLESALLGCLLIDCFTVDVGTARAAAAAAERGFDLLDAPVSGGTAGAEAAYLTFMVGGPADAFARALPILDAMGALAAHVGGAGGGQAAKICNNLMLATRMIGMCEAFAPAERPGLSPNKLYDVSSSSSGQCWSLTSYCPVPGPVPSSPSNTGNPPKFRGGVDAEGLEARP